MVYILAYHDVQTTPFLHSCVNCSLDVLLLATVGLERLHFRVRDLGYNKLCSFRRRIDVNIDEEDSSSFLCEENRCLETDTAVCSSIDKNGLEECILDNLRASTGDYSDFVLKSWGHCYKLEGLKE